MGTKSDSKSIQKKRDIEEDYSLNDLLLRG